MTSSIVSVFLRSLYPSLVLRLLRCFHRAMSRFLRLHASSRFWLGRRPPTFSSYYSTGITKPDADIVDNSTGIIKPDADIDVEEELFKCVEPTKAVLFK